MPKKFESDRQFLLNTLLKSVSRSFYLTLRILPKSSRDPISLAYLLARVADTITDTTVIPPDRRMVHLNTLTMELSHYDESQLTPLLDELEQNDNNSTEHSLLVHLPQILMLYHRFPKQEKHRIAHVLTTLISGMKLDLKSFPHEQSGQIGSLNNVKDLDGYTYLVAGCVGEFWTDICIAHEPQCQHWDFDLQKKRGIRLGKALQLTNVLRDIAQDLRIGRCYLPQTQLQSFGLTPEDLLNPQNAVKAKPVLDAWLATALIHYAAGADYAMALPRHAVRLRLAVFWPMLIGLATLRELASNTAWLSPDVTIKVSRTWIYKMMLLSLALSPSNRIMTWWLKRLDREIREQLHHPEAAI